MTLGLKTKRRCTFAQFIDLNHSLNHEITLIDHRVRIQNTARALQFQETRVTLPRRSNFNDRLRSTAFDKNEFRKRPQLTSCQEEDRETQCEKPVVCKHGRRHGLPFKK